METMMTRSNGVTSQRVARMGDRVHMQLGNKVVSCAIMVVSPEIARSWLEREHPNNRRTPSVTAKYVLEMATGGWRPSPEAIIFADTGELVDGGNRLRAIVDSGCSVTLTVWFDWPSEVFPHLNRGTSRSLVQADQMAGEAMPRPIYQMARAMILVDENRTTASDSETRRRARALLGAWGRLGESLTQIRIGRSGIRAPANLAFCIAWLSDPACAEDFVKQLVSASERKTVPSPPVRNYLRWYENTAVSTGNYAVKDGAHGAASALRQFATKNKVSFLKPSADAWTYWRDRPQVDEAFAKAAVDRQ